MSNLGYYSYEGLGKWSQEQLWYSQAVRICDRIECAGQGTRNQYSFSPYTLTVFEHSQVGSKTGHCHVKLEDQIDQAFTDVDLVLTNAGGLGWQQVFRVNAYHLPLDDCVVATMVRNFKQWMPYHQPIWTCVGVANLAQADMKVKIEGRRCI
jgi:enamine deaminase RidA (YjgF/YER057c/UK114 family)